MDMKNVKGCSTYLLVKEIQINIMRYFIRKAKIPCHFIRKANIKTLILVKCWNDWDDGWGTGFLTHCESLGCYYVTDCNLPIFMKIQIAHILIYQFHCNEFTCQSQQNKTQKQAWKQPKGFIRNIKQSISSYSIVYTSSSLYPNMEKSLRIFSMEKKLNPEKCTGQEPSCINVKTVNIKQNVNINVQGENLKIHAHAYVPSLV